MSDYDALEAKFKWMREEQARKREREKEHGHMRLDRIMAEQSETVKGGSKVRILVPHRNTFQRGMLKQRKSKRGIEWYCRFRLPRVSAFKARKEVHIALGLITEVTEAEAAEKMAALIEQSTKQKDFVKEFGMKAAARALQNKPVMSQAPDAKAVVHGLGGHVGAISELLVCVDLMGKGQELFRAINSQASCDLISHHNGEFTRIEVRTMPSTNGVSGGSMNLNNKGGKFDILALVHNNGGIDYIPYSSIAEDGMMYFKIKKSALVAGQKREGRPRGWRKHMKTTEIGCV